VGEGLGGDPGGVLAGFGAGSRVAGYLLEEQVGAGGMAVVFRARDERLRRLVALKVLGPALAADEDFRRRFIRESRAAAAVEDPHIIPVHEAGEAGGVLFIAMRYVPGGDVRTLLRRAGPLPPSQAAAIISPVASALDSAHAAGLVHRDVKPANMLLDVRPGRPDHVYLSDFGLSKGMLSLGLTGSGHFLGTPGYSAPEQIQGRPVDGRADQYALACTAFELLCGTAVFPRDEVLAVMYAHLSEPPPPLTGRLPGIPAAADAVFARALAKEPADRYASCRAFADALHGAFGLPPHHAAHETGPQLDHSAEITPPSAMTAGNDAPALTLTHSADLRSSQLVPGSREAAGSGPAGQHRARHARAQAQQTSLSPLPARLPSRDLKNSPPAGEDREVQAAARKPAVPRRAMLGLAAAATAGLAAAGWDLSHRTTTAPRHTPARHPPGGTPLWTTTIPSHSSNDLPIPPAVQTVVGGIVYVSTLAAPFEQYALRASNGAKLWSSSSLTVVQSGNKGIVYGVGADGLYAIHAADGQQLWHFRLQYPDPPSQQYRLAVDGETVYTSDKTGTVYAVSAENGNKLWSFATREGSSGIAAEGDVAYFCGWVSGVYAIRAGRQVWRMHIRALTGPVVSGKLVYVSSFSKLYALRAADGVKEWEFPLNINSELSAISNGIVYVRNRDHGIYALAADDGRELWQFNGDSTSNGLGVTAEGRTAYIASDRAVHALRAENGHELWRFVNQSPGTGLVVTPIEDTIYVANNNLHALRAADGKERWNLPVEVSNNLSSPSPATGVTVADGVVYFASTGNQVYAVYT